MAVDAGTLEEQKRLDKLRQLVGRQYKYIDRKWDAVFWITAAFVVGAAADITKLLFAGDWDFWTDWKDRLWWPILTPFALIIIGSALQYIQWLAWRFPTGMTYTAVCLWAVATLGRWLQWGWFVHYPLNFVWPTTMVAAAIFADWVLMKTKSFVLTGLIGAIAFTFAWWVSNYVSLAPYLQPAQWMDRVLTLSDIQGISYVRSQTPEYLRIVEHGTLRSFLGEIQYVSLVFGATVAVGGYWIGQAIGRGLAIWPIGRFMKKW
ncbi:MAG TPA: methane monooxygenase/ammonia monooxygenase subunit A [Actinomycetes bacterium]|nr:methane monooxygenase/ammonia monooxygenase subunit A [Actinomycetes bacterium]